VLERCNNKPIIAGSRSIPNKFEAGVYIYSMEAKVNSENKAQLI